MLRLTENNDQQQLECILMIIVGNIFQYPVLSITESKY